ncbi:MAG: DUF2877 domain-containing protein [Bacillota bacterium]|jgi:hypothetical protein
MVINLWAERCGCAPGTLLKGPGVVDTVFSRAINVRMPEGLCLSLVDAGLDSAPNRVILPPGAMERIRLHPGDIVEVREGRCFFQDTTIYFSPSNDEFSGTPLLVDTTIEVLQRTLSWGSGACLTFLGLDKGELITQKVALAARSLINNPQAGYNLIGLGFGFTPAGDDILTGYCALMRRLGVLNMEWCDNLIAKALAESTILSATSIYFACLGLVQELLDNVLVQLDNPAALETACRRVINGVGSTSGSDLLLGVLIGAHSHYLNISRTMDV